MSYHPTFDRNPKGKHADERAFSQVVVGTEAYVMEDEFNEMQAIVQRRLKSLHNRLDYDHVYYDDYNGKFYTAVNGVPSRPNTIFSYPFFAWVAGHEIYVSGFCNAADLTARPGLNILDVGEPPTSGTRTDLVILEVWEQVVSGTDILYKNGMQNSVDTLPNNLLDERVGQETSRRLQVQNSLRVLPGIANTSGMNSARDPLGGLYSYAGNGRWTSVNGYHAIPLTAVTRTQPSISYSELSTVRYQTKFANYLSGDLKSISLYLGDTLIGQTDLYYNNAGDVVRISETLHTRTKQYYPMYDLNGELIQINQV